MSTVKGPFVRLILTVAHTGNTQGTLILNGGLDMHC